MNRIRIKLSFFTCMMVHFKMSYLLTHKFPFILTNLNTFSEVFFFCGKLITLRSSF